MATDKFVPIDPSIVDQTDDATSASAPETNAPAPADPAVIAAAATAPAQRTPEQQKDLADSVALEAQKAQYLLAQQARDKLAKLKAARGPHDAESVTHPDSASLTAEERSALAADDQRLAGLQNVNLQAEADGSVPTALKAPLELAKGLGRAANGLTEAITGDKGSLPFPDASTGPDVGGTTGRITAGVAQFTAGMAVSGGALGASGLISNTSKAINVGRGLLAGGISGAVFQDPAEDNLSNLIQAHPTLANPINDFLAAKPDDGEALARFKKFTENVALGAGAEGLITSLKYIRALRAVKAGDSTAKATAAQLAQELPQTVQSGGSDYLQQAADKGVTIPEPKPLLPEPPRQLVTPEAADQLRASVGNTIVQANGGTDFNFLHLPDDYDAKAMINEVSKVVAPVVDDGVQTHASVQDVADMLGAKPAELIANIAKDAVGSQEAAARIVGGKALMVNLARQISDQSQTINAMVHNGVDSAGEEAKLLKLMNIHADLQANLKGTIKGAARATSAGNIDVREAAQLFAMADGNPNAVAKLVRPLTGGEKIAGVVAEWRANCLLSGVTTLAKKITADTLNAIALPAGKIIGGILHGDLPAIKEGASTYIGLMKGIGDSFSMARMALNEGQQFLTAGAGVVDNPRHFITSQQGGVIGTLVNALGSVVRLPTRLIGTIDEFSKQLNYRGALYAQATREGASKGLTGENLASWIEDYTSKAFDDAGRGTNTEALQYAKEATYTQDLDHGIARWLQDGANHHPVVRAVLPFIKVPTNLLRASTQYTPGIQFLSSQFRSDIEAGGTRAAAARGKQVIGGALYAQAVNLATSGRITGAGPQDLQARQALRDTGWQPYSLKIGDKYYSYAPLDPWAHMFGMTADFAEAAGQMNNDTSDKVATSMVLALARNLSSKTYYAGAVQTLDAMRGDENKALKMLQGFTGSFIPNTRQFTDILPPSQDPYMREARTVLDGVRKKIPGFSQTLPPSRNLFGEAIPMPAAFGPDTLSPFHTSTGTDDATLNELAKFHKGFSLPSKKVGNVDLTQIPSKEGGFDAYDRLLQLNGSVKVGGKNLKDNIANFIHSDKYQKLTDDGPGYSGSKFEELSALIGAHRAEALKALTAENPGVKGARKADLLNQKAALTKGPEAVNPLQNLMQTLQPH